MARGGLGLADWGNGGRSMCSYKRTAMIVCTINIGAALYVLQSLFSSVYIVSTHSNGVPHSQTATTYTKDQINFMEEAIRIRHMAEPRELLRLVMEIDKETSNEEAVNMPQPMKQKIAEEILHMLKELKGNATEQREALEMWRKEKLEEVKKRIVHRKSSNFTDLTEETETFSEMMTRVLESQWIPLLEDIGLWMPFEVLNKDVSKLEAEEELEDEIIAGKPPPPECHAERHTDYDGAAVRWGLTHHKESAADCCQACLDQAKRAKPGEKKCNIWVYCPSEAGCYSPDIYEHKHQECWLKQADTPRLNFKDKYSASYRSAHPTAPVRVPWISGVLSV
ncbi:uncharacterized protein LOC18425054 isoform X1 [Amborella trichopoda]|uniref:uncharacterized protein LOC18425054 isoform X1 n=1 Tax=Amborella trichopoda TaxID=13333 RepID=UPI0005D3C443|nr:uncharacterized protein LOC18425054 isoform X1 [Amborella trichopoda]XP_020517521.1 uncharacterized protein LOC18425054 isoform X1 [Amborella trichopoda]XP_020517522.1 uncharacterized protein LOC18425054 isoform X1 [Amborella trichopoda]XP_020517523.1 uncharacterized protein LOC18425054 isoform X1 [Amborella trichopoda]|eukprot:XP_011629222.1 uncharacterized protein LOC18425054 isoform X1 [Amborella trichopoda]